MSEYQLLSQKLKRRMMNWESYLHSFMILCCLYAECEGVKRVEAFLGETTNFTAVTGESIEIECKYRSGQIDQSKARQWYENSKLIISDGTLADPNSGYSENLKSDSFMLTTPPVNITFDGYKYTCIYEFDQSYVYLNVIEDVSPFEDSTTTQSTTINLSTDVETTLNTAMSETSTKMSTGSLSPTHTSVSLSESTPSASTESVGTNSETSTAPVTTSPSGSSEEMIVIISVVSPVGGILLIVIIVIVVLCCKRKTGTANKKNLKNKHDKLHVEEGKNKDLNSNYDLTQKNKYSAQSRRKLQGDTNLYQKHSQRDILYGGRIPPGAEFQRLQNYYQQNYIPGNHHYRKQYNTYYLPNTAPRNMTYYQRYPGSRYNEDMYGYSRAGPYRMQFYPKSYARHDILTDYELERRIGHARGQYESNWDDTLY